jgi:hypothetical protein
MESIYNVKINLREVAGSNFDVQPITACFGFRGFSSPAEQPILEEPMGTTFHSPPSSLFIKTFPSSALQA